MMTGSERRTAIINQIKNSTVPVSGKALAAQYAVSRQVIVQDIALIRAAGHEIISTNRGYLLNEDASVQRTFKVKHTDAQVEEELYSIVDLGGSVKNVMVNHRAYGHMEAELNITSRRKAAEFLDDIKTGKSSPLKNITSDYHYHVVEADSGYDRGCTPGERISSRTGRMGKKAVLRITKEREVRHQEPVSDLLTSSGIFCKIRIDKVKEKRFSVVSYDRMELYIWKK